MPVLNPIRDQILCLCAQGGLAGHPQVSLPGATVEGRPVGLSLLAARGADTLLVRTAVDGGDVMEVNIPEVVEEVRALFERFEQALVHKDVGVLDDTFWNSPHTIRYAIHENGYGFDEIHAHRVRRARGPGIKIGRRRLVITTLGRDIATVNLEFDMRGRDMPARGANLGALPGSRLEGDLRPCVRHGGEPGLLKGAIDSRRSCHCRPLQRLRRQQDEGFGQPAWADAAPPGTAAAGGHHADYPSVDMPEAVATHSRRKEVIMPSTVKLHRVLATKPEKVFRAFVEPDAIASWLPPNGYLCTVHELEATVGGRHRMSFRNFTTGGGHSFGGTYREIVPGERLVYTDRFDDARSAGRDDRHRDPEGRIGRHGSEHRAAGHSGRDTPRSLLSRLAGESLRKLAKLVEPEINQ